MTIFKHSDGTSERSLNYFKFTKNGLFGTPIFWATSNSKRKTTSTVLLKYFKNYMHILPLKNDIFG